MQRIWTAEQSGFLPVFFYVPLFTAKSKSQSKSISTPHQSVTTTPAGSPAFYVPVLRLGWRLGRAGKRGDGVGELLGVPDEEQFVADE